jgi:biotin transport system ATP-binding protein
MNSQPVLFSVRRLSKTFPNGFRALDNLDLNIYEGECLVIAGSNGSGKTVLMRILAGLLEPSEGVIRFREKELSRCGDTLRRSVGLVFQDADAQIIGETVEEDLRFGPENLKLTGDEVTRQVEEVLEGLDLRGKRDFSPRRLSGGEKRRLAVAGVLAMGCGTIIMDEPFANLDWPGVVQVLKVIRDLKAAGKTAVVLTHELEKVLAFADRLTVLDKGIIRADGRPEAVLDRLEDAWGVRDPRRTYRTAADCTWL